MLGLSANVNQPAVHVDLSNNEMKTEGGMVLGSCVANLKNIQGLDLSDNGMFIITLNLLIYIICPEVSYSWQLKI